ncbi:MAG: DNA alkylation repair protein [Prevotella sp.]|nr:DNA alkylation repair protein [Prevotella sp.]
MSILNTIITELQKYSTEEKRQILPRFFKTGKGEYGEGDKFLGVTVPNIRMVAKQFKDSCSLNDADELMRSEWHDVRMCALLLLIHMLKGADETRKKEVFDFYLSHTGHINNWDLVDVSAPTIVGKYLQDKDRTILYQLAESQSLWENRIAIVSTYSFIKKGDLADTYALAGKMMHHPHDLMHKAMGWMLREAGKIDKSSLAAFLEKHHREMPRTMLRYSIEKFPQEERKHFMKR